MVNQLFLKIKRRAREAQIARQQSSAVARIEKQKVRTAMLKTRAQENIKATRDIERARAKARVERFESQQKARKQIIPALVRKLESSGKRVDFKRAVKVKKMKVKNLKKLRNKKVKSFKKSTGRIETGFPDFL